MMPAYQLSATSVHYTTTCNTQSSAPEDGRNYRPKHVELIGIINKPLLLNLVGCLYYCMSDARLYKYKIYDRYVQKYMDYWSSRKVLVILVRF